MEFEDMKRIWKEEKQEQQFLMDEAQLLMLVQKRKVKARNKLNRLELFILSVYLVAGPVLLIIDQGQSLYLSILALGMLFMGAYIMIIRQKRRREDMQFDRTIKGELDHAIHYANYQVQLSFSVLVAALPTLGLMWLSFWSEGKSLQYLVGMMLFVVVTLVASIWEHQNIHIKHRSKLLELKKSLMNG